MSEAQQALTPNPRTLIPLHRTQLGALGCLRLSKLHVSSAKGLDPGARKWVEFSSWAMYVSLFLIGVGSTVLHSTLLALGQAADEAPMYVPKHTPEP